MAILRSIPLLAFVVIVYNAMVYVTGPAVTAPVFALDLPSAASWTVTAGDLLVAVALLFVYFEILKATRTSVAAVIDHALSMAVFVVCLLEFVLLPRFATTTFFLITLMAFIDVIAGFTVSLQTARRDLTVGTLDR
ncbi:MAG: hypothetical protein FJX67_17370 [Alphaproteobacteria bacterium]|nr:hypothetical protein [Alphaproteobacteria bacterium]